MTRRDERGFALVAVLWVVVAVGALALVARLAARDAVASTGNRVELARARWEAEGCAERARAAIDRALDAARTEGPYGPTWPGIDRVVAESPLTAGCAVGLEPVGATLDANRAEAETLRRLFEAAGAGAARADSLADALLDWRDADDQPRPLGAERAWYAGERRPGPRNAPFADPLELRRVRGMDRLPGADTLLGVEPGRVALNHAPAAVLGALPGLSAEAAARLIEMRQRGELLPELSALEGRLSPAGREAMLRSFPALSAATTTQPDAWVLVSRVSRGTPAVTAVIELKLVRAGARAAVVRERTWME
jgi:general secretion pathway protein K